MKLLTLKRKRLILPWFLALIVFSGAEWEGAGSAGRTRFTLLSPACKYGETMPDRYSSTERGENLSPPLQWSAPPKGTRSLALIAEDPDIPLGFIFCHWVIYNIPAERRELAEGISGVGFADGTVQGKNGYGQNRYLGPAPVWGTHRYIFKLYALDTTFRPDAGMSRKALLGLMKAHILEQTEWVGRYTKK